MAVSGQSLQFNMGDTEICYNITINPDETCELPDNEGFTSDLVLVGGVQPITVTITPATVIIHDTDEPECGKLCSNRV